jgi:MATE family multidrug resistance protein
MNTTIPISNRRIWALAGPIIISNISVPLVGAVDTAVVGRLPNPQGIGAVALGALIFSFLYWGFGFLRMGTTGFVARAIGARDQQALFDTLLRVLLLAFAFGLLTILLSQPVIGFSLHLLDSSTAIERLTRDYAEIRIWSAPATLSSYALIGWFIGLQNARVPLMVVMVTNAVNIALDLWFVLGLGMTVDGVALASVIAEYTGLAVAIFFVMRELSRHPGRWLPEKLTGLNHYRAFVAINGHLFIRTIALVSTFTFVTAQGARMGGLVLAANAVLMNFQNLLSFALDGLAHAAEALVGKAVGAKNDEALRQSVRISLRWSLVIAVGFCAIFWVFGPALIALLTNLPDVRATTLEYLPWLVISPLVSVWSFLYDGVFVGATRAREMRDIMLVSAIVIFLPAWYLLQPLGNHGLWLAFTLFMAGRGIGMHYFYRTRMVGTALV